MVFYSYFFVESKVDEVIVKRQDLKENDSNSDQEEDGVQHLDGPLNDNGSVMA